jgi:catechol 1,2-dioxygenase
MGRHPNRAAHLHFIDAPGFQQVITHIFPPDCPYLHEDTVFGVKEELVADFKPTHDTVLAGSWA